LIFLKSSERALQEHEKMKMTAFAVGGVAAIIVLIGVAFLVSAGSGDDPLGTGSDSGFVKKVQKALGDVTREQAKDGSCGEIDPAQTQTQEQIQAQDGSCGETDPAQTQTQEQTQAQDGSCDQTEADQSQDQTQDRSGEMQQDRDQTCDGSGSQNRNYGN
jgi:uncharacterized low-complexity protein